MTTLMEMDLKRWRKGDPEDFAEVMAAITCPTCGRKGEVYITGSEFEDVNDTYEIKELWGDCNCGAYVGAKFKVIRMFKLMEVFA